MGRVITTLLKKEPRGHPAGSSTGQDKGEKLTSLFLSLSRFLGKAALHKKALFPFVPSFEAIKVSGWIKKEFLVLSLKFIILFFALQKREKRDPIKDGKGSKLEANQSRLNLKHFYF
ncbi:Hypothetical protein Minf_0750 [Methylacidiphilum infernorum V4]|uniref:Uncharacterized protein n=1 Tax=Methylacidiphilum infernorum (isolate V4) TaxID=481448 RepID=B3E0Q1_METI4|nr:Hypothetical protein Minf_0750 [Methylacidiphilum infernorum V4]